MTIAFCRLSCHHHESNGFRDNTFLDRDDTNGRDETPCAAACRAGCDDLALSIWPRSMPTSNDGYDAFALDNTYTMLSDKPGKDAQESVGCVAADRLERFRRYGTLTSITRFADSDIEFSFDADWGNDDSWAPVTYDYVSCSDRQRQTLSQEFR